VPGGHPLIKGYFRRCAGRGRGHVLGHTRGLCHAGVRLLDVRRRRSRGYEENHDGPILVPLFAYIAPQRISSRRPAEGLQPSGTTRIFSSAEKCRRGARRMSLIASSASASPARISVSSSLLAATMIQKSSLTSAKPPRVLKALMADTGQTLLVLYLAHLACYAFSAKV
jgi:hypothetical protein